MTQEQLMKLDFLFYMTIANSPIYSLEQRNEARNIAINIGSQLNFVPMEVNNQQDNLISETSKAFIDGPEDLADNIMR